MHFEMHSKCLFNKQCTYHYQMEIIYFNLILKNILKNMLKDYLTILIGDFNIDMLKKKTSINNITKPYVQIQIETHFY